MFKKFIEYRKIAKEYREYLEEIDQVSYQKYFEFVNIDYSKQKKLQTVKTNEKDVTYRITFNNSLVQLENNLFLEEYQSFLDPNIFLFQGNKNIYKDFINRRNEKQKRINKFIYSQLKSTLSLEERMSSLSLKKERFNGITFKKYFESLDIEKNNYKEYWFLKNIENNKNITNNIEKYVNNIINNFKKKARENE